MISSKTEDRLIEEAERKADSLSANEAFMSLVEKTGQDMGCPFDADEVREMTPKEKVAHARKLRSRGVALAKEATELKSQAKDYHPAIFEYLEELGTDKINIDGKALSVKEIEEWTFPQEHKREIIKWCVSGGVIPMIKKAMELYGSHGGLSMKHYHIDDADFEKEKWDELLDVLISNSRVEFLDVPTAKFKTACKAAVEAEMDLPPHATQTTYNKLNGV